MKTILVLTDFSIRANHAAYYALKLAKKVKANLLVCNVFLLPSTQPMAAQVSWSMENYETFQDDSINEVSELAGRLNKQLDKEEAEGEFRPAIEQSSIAGLVADALDEIVASHDIIMTVLSMHGANGITSFLLGNHAREVIENADCPVLLVPDLALFNGYKKIAFATDLTLSDVDVVHSLSGLAKYSNSEILITHVADERSEEEGDRDRIKNFFRLVSSENNYPKIYYRQIQNKSVASGLQWLSDHTDIDILVTVHRKLGFFQRLFNGSVTQKLANHLNKPVLVFPFSKGQQPSPLF